MDVSRGVRNKNPFNIKRSVSKWKGKVPHDLSIDSTFERFYDIEFGFRAGLILLRNYIRKGYDTPDKIIKRFAPGTENNVGNYIDFVCDDIYLPKNCKLYFGDTTFYRLVYRMLLYESRFMLLKSRFDAILQKFNIKL